MLPLKVQALIQQKKLFQSGDRILIGVSGGADSLALLDVLHGLSARNGWEICAAHLNHQFRGEEAAEDARFVRQFCAERGIPCKIGEIDVPRLIRETGQNPQKAAREARYSFFREVAKETGMNKLALAHHANDQAETVLMRILRGTGMEGLAGIPLVRKEDVLTIVRPFLPFYKEELEAYCRQRQINPRLDSSNLKTYYRRNFLRLEIIPHLEKTVNPLVQQALVQLSEIASAENGLLDRISREALQQIIQSKQERKMVIKGKLFLTFDPALQRRMIKLIFNYLVNTLENIGFVHIDQTCEWIREGRNSSVLELPSGIYAIKEYDEIIFTTYPPARNGIRGNYLYTMEMPGRTYIKEIQTWVTATVGETAAGEMDGYTASFDYHEIEGKIIIRTRRPGDRMTILGMAGTKKVKDILIDCKIPRAVRDEWPIIADEQKILWIPGVKRSNDALLGKDTKKIVTIQVHCNRHDFRR